MPTTAVDTFSIHQVSAWYGCSLSDQITGCQTPGTAFTMVQSADYMYTVGGILGLLYI